MRTPIAKASLGNKCFKKNMGPMGPRGLGPNPFSTVSACPPGVFFRQKRRLTQKKVRISKKIGVFFEIFVILANVDPNLRFKICKIVI